MTQHHDPVHPDSPHLTAEMVADLDEGLLDADSTAHAEAHLSHCVQCRGLHAQFRALSQALRSLPPIPMPADQVAALDAALAELSQSATAPVAAIPPAGPTDPTDTVVPLDSARRARAGWSTRLATIAASVAGVLLVSAVGLSLLSDKQDANGSLGSNLAEAEIGADGTTLADYRAERSGGAYRAKTLDRQVDTLLVSYASSEGDASAKATVPSEAPPAPTVTATVSGAPTAFVAPMADPAVVHACIVEYLERPDAAPLAVDIGTFNGIPAAIVVLPSLDDVARAEVYVVGPDCAGPDATLLYWAVVDLPESLQR